MEWFKVMCNFLDHRKIKLIRKGPKGDTIVLLWLALIAEAGKCGRGGALLISDNNPYTVETLCLLLDMRRAVVKQGLDLFTKLEMIIWEDNVIHIRNWSKYQSEDKLAKRRESDRRRQQKRRCKEEAVSRDSHDTLSRDVTVENRQEENRIEKTTTDSVRKLLSHTPLSKIGEQELAGLLQRYGPEQLPLAADVGAETYRRDGREIRNPGGYLNTLCENLVVPGWYVPLAKRQQREEEARELQEKQAVEQAAQQAAEEAESNARDDLWQSLPDEEREEFCAVARNDFAAGTHTSEEVVVILAKLKAWEAQQVSGSS